WLQQDDGVIPARPLGTLIALCSSVELFRLTTKPRSGVCDCSRNKLVGLGMLRPPGPKPHFLVGNIPLAGPAPLDPFRRSADELGYIFYYRVAWLHVSFLNRPDLIESVLGRNPQNFMKDRVVQNSRWLLGTGLLTAEGEGWKRQRRLIQPAFARDRTDAYARC